MISKSLGKVALFVVHFTFVRLLVSETMHETNINISPTRSEHFSLKEICITAAINWVNIIASQDCLHFVNLIFYLLNGANHKLSHLKTLIEKPKSLVLHI